VAQLHQSHSPKSGMRAFGLKSQVGNVHKIKRRETTRHDDQYWDAGGEISLGIDKLERHRYRPQSPSVCDTRVVAPLAAASGNSTLGENGWQSRLPGARCRPTIRIALVASVRAVDRQWSRRHCRMQSCEEKHEITLSWSRSSHGVHQPRNVLAFQFMRAGMHC
jgi:hypothetical protein